MISIDSITKAEMNDESSTKTISSTTIIKDDVKLKELKRKQKNKKYKFTVDSESGFAAVLAFVDCEIPIGQISMVTIGLQHF